MNLFGFNISRATRPAPLVTKSLGPDTDSWLRGEDLASAGAVLSNAYQQVVWVYRAINVLAEQIGNIPFLFSSGDRGRENLITHGPLVNFYDHPHPQINRFQYWELRIIWLMLRGECFRIPIYDRVNSVNSPRRRLSRITLADPAHFQHIIEDHQLLGWRYTGFGRETPLASQVFLPEEVWFEKLPNPFNFWRGLAPLRVAGLADEPLLLWNAAEIVQPQLSSSDLQFLENRKFSRGEICAAFGVPEEIVTATEHAKYDVMAGARLNFIENRVVPLCRRLEAEEDVVVKSIEPEADGWFDVEDHPVLTQARSARLAAARAGFDMGIPFNDLNRAFDLGFRPLPWGDQGYVPNAMQPVGAASPKSEPRSPNREEPIAHRSQEREDVFSRLTAALTTNGSS